MQRRLLIILGAAVVGGVFVAGLFIQGRGGGVLLALVAVVLIAMFSVSYQHLPPKGRGMRVVIMAAVCAIAAVKLITG